MDRFTDWIVSGERPLPRFVAPFAKAASGGGGNDDENDDDSGDDEEDDEEDDDDDLADLSDEDLRAELKKTRASLKGTNASDAKKRAKIRRLNAELEEAKKPKPVKPKADDAGDEIDVESIRHEARSEGEKAGLVRAKKAEAKSSLLAAGVNSARVARAVGLLDLDELDLDDDGLDGIDDAIEDLKKDWPELFAKKRQRRQSVAGDRDDEREPKRRSTKTASEKAAAQLLGRG